MEEESPRQSVPAAVDEQNLLKELAPQSPEPRRARFCGACGARLEVDTGVCPQCPTSPPPPPFERTRKINEDIQEVKSAILLYMTMLGCSVIMIVAIAFKATTVTDAMLYAQITMSILVLAWSLVRFDLVKDALWPGRLVCYGWALIIPIGTYLVAAASLATTHHLLNIKEVKLLDSQTLSISFATAIGWVCVQPAVFEELAFRGVIQGAVAKVATPTQAMLISAGMFALLHLSVFSLPHLFVLGLALGWLRQKSGSLYPGMIVHFTHNLIVLAVEEYGGHFL